MRIRAATAADIDHILHHRVQMFREMGKNVEGVESVSRQYLERALPDGGYQGWLAENEDGAIVAGGGVVIAAWPGFPGESQPRRAWILNVYTEPQWRRRGIAKAMMDIILAWCRTQGFAAVSLHASDDGRRLYEAMGFVPTNEMRLVVKS